MRVSSLDSEGRARWTRLAALSPPPFRPESPATEKTEARSGETVPAAPEMEIHDWIHDWNRATQEIHDWQPFEI